MFDVLDYIHYFANIYITVDSYHLFYFFNITQPIEIIAYRLTTRKSKYTFCNLRKQ